MRTLVLRALAMLTLAAAATSQSLPLAQAPNNQGNVGGGLYFNMTVTQTLTINSIAYYCSNDAVGNFQSSFNMFVGPGTWVGNVGANPGPWILVGSTTPSLITGGTGVQNSGATQLVTGVMNPSGLNSGTVTFLPGTYGIALQAVNHSWRYQNFAAPTTFANADLSVTAGAASNGFLALPTFSPRVICGQINYTLGGTPMLFAQREPYGAGCYRNFRSFYELFPTSIAIDLANTSLLLTLDGSNNRYIVSAGGSPVNTAIVTSAPLGHLDNQNIPITLAGPAILHPGVGGIAVASAVEMCSNGYVNLQGTVPAVAGTPTVAQWLTGAATRIGNNRDLNPPLATAGNGTFYDFDVVTNSHVFTWLGVPDTFTAATSNTFQMVFLPNGDVELRWGAMSLVGGGSAGTLVGFTTGNGAADPGTMDITASLPFFTSGIDQPPLTLIANVNPVLNTTVNLTTSNVTGSNLGLCFVTVANLPQSPVGLDLGIIGAPGCVANVDINAGVGNVISNLGSPLPGLSIAFQIPAGPPAIIGQSFYSQSAWLDATQNALGIITSNAIRLKIGAF
jgi:hypothetical protein